MEDLAEYQQKIAHELFVLAHTGNRTEARIEIESIMRKQIALEIEDYRTQVCKCEKHLLPLCEHLLAMQERLVPTDK